MLRTNVLRWSGLAKMTVKTSTMTLSGVPLHWGPCKGNVGIKTRRESRKEGGNLLTYSGSKQCPYQLGSFT